MWAMSDQNGMSLSDDVPTPVRAFVDATNAGDAGAVVGLFTPDASVSTPGREFMGRDEAAEWDRADNTGTGRRLELLAVRAGDSDREVIATLTVSTGGEQELGELRFTLRGEAIARLVDGL